MNGEVVDGDGAREDTGACLAGWRCGGDAQQAGVGSGGGA